LEESELIQKARTGDSSAFAELMVAYLPDVRLILRSLTGSSDTADLEQDVFLAVFLGIRRFTGGSAFSTWLYRICRNKTIDHIRREQRRRAVTRLLRREAPIHCAQVNDWLDPQQSLARADLLLQYEEALRSLGAKDRAILTLKDREGVSLEGIASLFGMPLGTVKSRLHRSRSKVLSFLEVDHET